MQRLREETPEEIFRLDKRLMDVQDVLIRDGTNGEWPLKEMDHDKVRFLARGNRKPHFYDQSASTRMISRKAKR